MGGGGPRGILLPPSSSSPPARAKLRLNTLSRGKNGARVSPAFSRCVRTISRARKRRREGRNGRREDGEESVWILYRGLNVVLRDNRCSTPPLLFFFPHRCFCARHAKKFFLSRRCQNRTGGGRDLIYRGGGISSFSIAAPLPPPEGEISTRYPSSNKIPP